MICRLNDVFPRTFPQIVDQTGRAIAPQQSVRISSAGVSVEQKSPTTDL